MNDAIPGRCPGLVCLTPLGSVQENVERGAGSRTLATNVNEDSAMPRPTARNARLEARISPETLDVVKRAAEIQGRTLSDFVVTAPALERAALAHARLIQGE
jgi:hypothetical protein